MKLIPIPGNEDEWRKCKTKLKTDKYRLIFIANALEFTIQESSFHESFKEEMKTIRTEIIKEIGPLRLEMKFEP